MPSDAASSTAASLKPVQTQFKAGDAETIRKQFEDAQRMNEERQKKILLDQRQQDLSALFFALLPRRPYLLSHLFAVYGEGSEGMRKVLHSKVNHTSFSVFVSIVLLN